MPKITNPVVINKIRQGLLQGKPDNKVLLNAGISAHTANKKANKCKILKRVKEGINKELKAKDITVDWLLSEYERTKALAEHKGDMATSKAATDSIAKYVAQIPDKSDINLSKEKQADLLELSKRFSITSLS